jgi:hypothetical protein
MGKRVDFRRIFWCSSHLMFPSATTVARPSAPTVVVSILTLLISLVLINVGICVPTATG